MPTVKITAHAYKRLKQRCGWNAKASDRMCEKIFANGLSHSDLRGSIKRYVGNAYAEYGVANNIRVYGNHLFIFADNRLITIYELPREYNSVVRKFASESKRAVRAQ